MFFPAPFPLYLFKQKKKPSMDQGKPLTTLGFLDIFYCLWTDFIIPRRDLFSVYIEDKKLRGSRLGEVRILHLFHSNFNRLLSYDLIEAINNLTNHSVLSTIPRNLTACITFIEMSLVLSTFIPFIFNNPSNLEAFL